MRPRRLVFVGPKGKDGQDPKRVCEIGFGRRDGFDIKSNDLASLGLHIVVLVHGRRLVIDSIIT